MNRPENFKKELIELLAKYDAQIEVKEALSPIHSPTIEVFFNSQWENERICIDECRTLNLGTEVLTD